LLTASNNLDPVKDPNGMPLKTPALAQPHTASGKLLTAILVVLVIFLPVHIAAQAVDTDPLNRDPAVHDAFQHFYDMDYDGSLARFARVQAAHPADPIATDYILYVTLFRELFRLDLLDTTFYANDGFLTGKHTIVEDPKARDEIKSLSDKAFNQANDELRKNPNDVNALFARGWARSLEATYLAMVERSFGAGLRLALGAKNDHEKVLQLDPNYVDAKMVTGIYEYVVGALPFAFKLLIGFAGIHGSKTEGMAMLKDAAARGVITSVESRTSMSLFLRREAKYQQALAITRTLKAQYPHDYLFCLEEANLSKDAGEGMKAVDLYRQLVSEAKQPGYFASAHLELAYFGLGDSLRGQRLYQESIDAYREGAFLPTTSPELKRRCLLAAGEDYDLMNEHDKARQQYQEVIEAGNNTTQADLASKYIRSAYKGR
jgi:tetratricopeptide (TPR) repeat protein